MLDGNRAWNAYFEQLIEVSNSVRRVRLLLSVKNVVTGFLRLL